MAKKKIKTKDKILHKALELFNKHGFEKVSLRDISGELKISLGNLTYHYKKRDDIIYALYLQVVEHLDEKVAEMMAADFDFEILHYLEVIQKFYGMFYEFRFIFADSLQVYRGHPQIREFHTKLLQMRMEQFRFMLSELQKKGHVRKEAYDGEFDLFIIQAMMTVENFIGHADLTYKIPKKKWETYIMKLMGQSIMFYLTEEGKQRLKPELDDLEVPSLDKLFK